MPNKLEKKLWKEIGWLRFILAITVTIVLGVAYFAIWQWNTSIWRELYLGIIANLIPIPVVFILVYIAFRRIEELRSERDAEELADKVVLRLIEIAKIQTATSGESRSSLERPIKFSQLEMKIHREFEITNKYFDNKSKPQRIVAQFTNRGNNVIHLKKVTYSDTGLGLPKSALSRIYRLDNGRDILIPLDQGKSEILPECQYAVELCFDEKQDVSKINGWSGKWGYLHLELVYADETLNLQYSI